MKKIFTITLTLFMMLTTSTTFAMNNNFSNSELKRNLIQSKFEKITHMNWKEEQETPSFLYGQLSTVPYNDELEISQYLSFTEDIFQLDPERDLTLMKVESDDIGMTHYKFNQSVNGVPVEGAEFVVHTDENGFVKAVNGNLKPSAKSAILQELTLTNIQAISAAWKSIGLSKKDTLVEDMDGPELHADKIKNTVEKSNLVVYEFNNTYYLAYRVALQFIEPYPANWQIYVDANNGNIINSFNAVAHGGTTGYGYGVLDDYKVLNTYYYNNYYYLYDITKPMSGVIEVRTANNGYYLPGNYSVDNNNAFTAYSQAADVDAHYYAGVVYDYFLNTHNRNSYDNAGATIRSTVHYQSNYNNAFWNGSQMVYGDGDGSTFTALSGSLDVVAHELTHAVTEKTANLVYQDQSGALNESMSDVFGYFVEPNDYLIGEDVYTPGISGDALRSISDPTAFGQPDHMDNYLYTSADNGGVHTNSGIPNKAAYYTITSIGKTKAEQIYYRALSVYLTSTSDFSDARAALLAACADLYGTGSEYSAIQNAWDQVGVY